MKTKNNLIMRFLSGMLGRQVVAKEWKGRPYIASAPTYPKDRKFTERQVAHQERFRDATVYAKAVQDIEIYKDKAKKQRLTSYQVALRDFMKPPVIRQIEIRHTKELGMEVVVRAIDDTEVVGVHVALKKDGSIIEEGDAVRDKYNATIWRCTTREENVVAGTTVEVYATDRPGNVTLEEIDF